MKKYFLVGLLSLILGLLLSIAILTYKDTVILKPNLTVEFNTNASVSDFIYHLDGTLLEDKTINTTKLGTQKIKYNYKNNYGWYKTGTFNVEVIDTTSPIIMVKSILTLSKGYDKKLEDTILCGDEASDNVKCQIEGTYNLNKVGLYNLKITAIDESNNKTEKSFILNIINNTNNTDTSSYINYKDIYGKYKNTSTLIGLDISKWQEEVDFEKLKKNNVEFIMIKLGGQSEIDGEINLDPYFYDNLEQAINNNIKVGLYFYSYAKTPKEAKNQAKYILNAIKDYDITMPIAFDWENWTNYNEFNLSFYNLNSIAQSFINEINTNGYKSLLYTSKTYLENIWYKENYNLWLANYSNTQYQYPHKMWQVCSDGKINGINGYVDIDVYFK